MKYMGSKRRIWKHISPIILKDRNPEQYYVEPFCGGCNSIAYVDGKRIASDINLYLIKMWKGLLCGENYPDTISRETYNEARSAYKEQNYTTYSQSELAWIGYMASYNGLFYHSYSGIGSDGRDYIKASIANIMSQVPLLQGCEFCCCSYDSLEIPEHSIIYCDIPYKGTKDYEVEFDYPKFYDWCFSKKAEGHAIFISEYSMPPEFTCIWSMEVSNSLDRYSKVKGKRMEKLFTV